MIFAKADAQCVIVFLMLAANLDRHESDESEHFTVVDLQLASNAHQMCS